MLLFYILYVWVNEDLMQHLVKIARSYDGLKKDECYLYVHSDYFRGRAITMTFFKTI